jgi:predicted aspartyl protease
MGTFYVGCRVENQQDRKRAVVVPVMVDASSEFTWLPAEILHRIGVESVKKDMAIQMADGQILTRAVGPAMLRVDRFQTIDEVVFGQKGDASLLGSRAMEGMNVHVDTRRKRLVAGSAAA